jgi:hypothetical protein
VSGFEKNVTERGQCLRPKPCAHIYSAFSCLGYSYGARTDTMNVLFSDAASLQAWPRDPAAQVACHGRPRPWRCPRPLCHKLEWGEHHRV